MKKIYILLTRSDTWVSRVIGLVTKDAYTHASISFEPDLQPMYSFSRWFVSLPLPAGLRVEPLDKGFYKKYDHIPCALYELAVPEEIYDAAKGEVERMMQDACPFNLMGLVLCQMQIPFHRENQYFCSEFVGEVLERSHALAMPKAPSLMRPNDYACLPQLSCCFEGRLNELLGRALMPAAARFSMLTPRIHSPYNCGIVSVGDILSLTITRRGEERGVERMLAAHLLELGAELSIAAERMQETPL